MVRSSGEAPATASRAGNIGALCPNAEALDEAIEDCAGRLQRDLLRRDRPDEHLERLGRERGPKASEPGDLRRSDRIGLEPREVELGAEELEHDPARLLVERLDVHAAGRCLDPNLRPPTTR